MRFKSFQEFLLEKNKTVDYFRNNPEARQRLLQFADVERGRSEWEPVENMDRSSSLHNKAKKPLIKGLNGLKAPQTLIDLADSDYGAFSSKYDLEKLQSVLDKSRRAGDIKKNINSLPAHIKNDQDIDNIVKFIDNNLKQFKSLIKSHTDRMDGMQNRGEKRFEKEMFKLGLHPNDVKTAMTWLDDWVSKSYKKLPKETFAMLQKISVEASLLPKYVYRGLFYDGAKIKDQAKFLKKWYPGSQPGVSQRKATSWSVDPGTASSFMVSQDRVKDPENGYYVMLKWKVNPTEVVADLRNLPVEGRFWNQQEIIVSPDAKDYEVAALIPYDDKDQYQKYIESFKGGSGTYGETKSSYLTDFMFKPYDQLQPHERINFKMLAYITLKEAMDQFGVMPNANKEWIEPLMDSNFSLASVIYQFSGRGLVDPFQMEVRSASKNKAVVRFIVNPSIFGSIKYGGDRYGIKDMFNEHPDYNQYSVLTEAYMDVEFNVEYNGVYDVDVNITKLKDFSFDDSQSNDSSRKYDEMYKDMVKSVGFDYLWDKMQENSRIKNLPSNISVSFG